MTIQCRHRRRKSPVSLAEIIAHSEIQDQISIEDSQQISQSERRKATWADAEKAGAVTGGVATELSLADDKSSEDSVLRWCFHIETIRSRRKAL
jgi:hypothetical protein